MNIFCVVLGPFLGNQSTNYSSRLPPNSRKACDCCQFLFSFHLGFNTSTLQTYFYRHHGVGNEHHQIPAFRIQPHFCGKSIDLIVDVCVQFSDVLKQVPKMYTNMFKISFVYEKDIFCAITRTSVIMTVKVNAVMYKLKKTELLRQIYSKFSINTSLSLFEYKQNTIMLFYSKFILNLSVILSPSKFPY